MWFTQSLCIYSVQCVVGLVQCVSCISGRWTRAPKVVFHVLLGLASVSYTENKIARVDAAENELPWS
jgi:hypothetical protein